MVLVKIFGCIAVAATAAGLLTGCETLSDRRSREAQDAAQMRHMRQDVRQMMALSEEAREQRHQLDERVARNEEEFGQRYRSLQKQIADLQRDLAQLHADRERMRREIVEEISVRVSRIIEQQQASRPQQARAQTGFEHEVGIGQTLSEIASAYGVTVDAIVRANNITDPHRIRVGQKLFIPE